MDEKYQWEKCYHEQTPTKDMGSWKSRFGPQVLERNEDGSAKSVQFSLLKDSKAYVYLIGDFNNWEQDLNKLGEYKFSSDEHNIFATLTLTNIVKHKAAYKLLVVDLEGKRILQDPAASYFDDMGNSVFWDFQDPSSYRQQQNTINTFTRSTKILQTDLPGLITHYSDKQSRCGKDVHPKNYYKFISESGVIDSIKELGFNTVQFLPFAQSIDGENWKFRYLVPFQFAIQKNWGTPDEFARMVDAFHERGIAVIGDFVLGHLPFKDYSIFGQDCKENGLQVWKKDNGTDLYLKDETSWGTKRLDFDNTFVREFFISSCLHFLKQYRIDGFRIDNVDGILRYGDTGEGEERQNGRVFLRELTSSLYAYNPAALLHFEAHYFYEDNAKLLVTPLESSDRSLGATAYNESRLTYFFHADYMPKAENEISPWKIRDIISEKEWGQSNSTVSDFHNHDAAAGLMEMRATGSYAYDAMTCKQPHNHIHALGKIKVMEALIAFTQEGRILDLLQTFLMQSGTFEHDSSVHWHLTYNEASRNLLQYKKRVNEIMDDKAFWPLHVDKRKVLSVDEKNKVFVIERSSDDSKYVIVLNLSSWRHYNYKVGLTDKNKYELVLNSDEFGYAGFGLVSYPAVFENNASTSFELLDREVELSSIAPYGVVVLRQVRE